MYDLGRSWLFEGYFYFFFLTVWKRAMEIELSLSHSSDVGTGMPDFYKVATGYKTQSQHGTKVNYVYVSFLLSSGKQTMSGFNFSTHSEMST